MPKILTAAMRAHLDAETTRLAAIWRITRKDGAQFFFTDHDRDIVFSGDTYRANAGFERTAIRSDAGFAVDNLDLVGVFAEGGIVEDEVRAGLFDGAEIRVAFVNWEDPDGHGEIKLRRGTLGETRLTPQGYFHAELRGLSQPLAQSTLEVFSPNCRADLGDQRCKFPIDPPELGRDQAVSKGAFYRVPTTAGTGSVQYEDRIYEVIEAGTTASTQPAYDAAIGAVTTEARRAKERKAELAALTHRERLDEAEKGRAQAEAIARKAEREALAAQAAEELRARVAVGLPGHWQLESFEIKEQAWRGEGESEFALSFAAQAKLAMDTFSEAERRDAVLFVTPVAAAGERRTIYGVGTARRAGQGWEYEIKAQNNPVTGLGRPIDYFEGRVLVQGSEEAKAYFEQQHQQELMRRQREEELREQEREAALAQQRHEQLLEEERQKVELARVAFEEQLTEEREARKQREAQRARQRAEQEVAAISEALASSDPAIQSTAFNTTLKSEDPRLRNQALSYFLAKVHRLPVQLTLPQNAGSYQQNLYQQSGSFALDIAQFDAASGRISGQFISGIRMNGDERTFSGALSGDSVSVASSRCQFEGRLSEDRVLRGKIRCSQDPTRMAGGELLAVVPIS